MALKGCYACLKYTVVILNLLFWVSRFRDAESILPPRNNLSGPRRRTRGIPTKLFLALSGLPHGYRTAKLVSCMSVGCPALGGQPTHRLFQRHEWRCPSLFGVRYSLATRPSFPLLFFLLYLFNVKRGLQPATLAVGLRWSDYEDRLECGMAFLCGLLRCEILFIQLAMRVARSVVTCRAARLSSFYGAADSLTRLELVHSAPWSVYRRYLAFD